MASPRARGLFHRAIGESGAAFSSSGLPFKSLAEREHLDAEFANSAWGSQRLADLRALPASKILEAAAKASSEDLQFTANVDGYFLPESVPAIFAAGKQNVVNLLAGWNHDEAGPVTVAPGDPPAIEQLKTIARNQFGVQADPFLKSYPANSEDEAKRSLRSFIGDCNIAWSTWKWLEAEASAGRKPVYRYRFDLSLPSAEKKEGLGAYHSAEIEYVFGTLDSKAGIPWRKEDRELSDLMQQYWVNFARSGDPNGVGLPLWPTYQARGGWPVIRGRKRPAAPALFNSEHAVGKIDSRYESLAPRPSSPSLPTNGGLEAILAICAARRRIDVIPARMINIEGQLAVIQAPGVLRECPTGSGPARQGLAANAAATSCI
jgi:para-nitrobenzyl esterase